MPNVIRHTKEKKILSAKGLLKITRKIFKQVSLLEPSSSRAKNICLSDCLMSAIALFSLKSPSLFAFDGRRDEPTVQHNLKTLYGIQHVPSDTYIRERLDEINPIDMRSSFFSIFEEARKGKLLEQYRFLGGYLLLLDGTQVFNSEKVHCKNCCKKNHRDGRISYYHQILGGVIAHPDRNQVIPLCPEPITKQDGTKKNDCERNAARRFLKDLKKEHPRLQATIVSDALYANAPQIKEIQSYGYRFIINVKPEGNRTLYQWLNGLNLEEKKVTIEQNQYTLRYINKVPLNDTENAPEVNFLECDVVEVKGRKMIKKHFSWVTNHEITQENVYQLMQGGRARWKVENETFNTLKNQGYQFEHNFGHGKKNLHTVFSMLMMLAFLIDQIQEAMCGLFQQSIKSEKTRRAFWEKFRGFFFLYFVHSWEDIYRAISDGSKRAELILDTS